MKNSKIVIIVLLVIILGGAIYYFSLTKDKCSGVTCSSGSECNLDNGKCESSSLAADNNLDSSTLTGMDKIERAIQDKLVS